MVNSGVEHGFTRRASLLGVKLGLAHEFGKYEYFTAEDVAEIFGMSVCAAEDFLTEQADKGVIGFEKIPYCSILQ